MRAHEFILEHALNDLVIKHKPTNEGHRAIETVDVDAIHAAALREHLLSSPALYEDRDDFRAMRAFLDTHKTPEPMIKKSYVYASVQTTPVSKYASLAHFDNRHRLVDIDEQYAYFDINGSIKRFPESGKLSGDSMSQIYFFNSTAELAQFNTLLQLKFSDYKFTSKTLDYSGVEENFADGNKKIVFRVKKSRNKFATEMFINDQPVGVYQYNADTGRSIAEIDPEFQNQGLGKILVLHAIYTAAQLGMDFQEDESRTTAYDNVLDSLSSNGYIVDDDGYWYVTGAGEQFLNTSLNENFADGKVKGKSRPGRVKRAGASCKGSVTSLRKRAKAASGERAKMYHWCANMKSGK